MASSTLIVDYVGRGTNAARPVAPNIPAGATAVYYETDTTDTFVWSGAAWVQVGAADFILSITTPANGDLLIYDSGSGFWKNQRPSYIIGSFFPGVMGVSQNIVFHRVAKAITFPANFGAVLGANSQAGGSTNATGITVINVDQAPTATPNIFTNIGTITIAAGTVIPTFATAGGLAIPYAQGDVLRIQGPLVADLTFADFYVTLVASDP